jgi:uncharacterized membrane protein YbhN (UPF0104 family)
MQNRKSLFTALRWALVLVVACGFVIAVRGLRLGDMRSVFASAHPAYLVAAALLNMVNLACKSECWRVLLAPEYPVPAGAMLRYTVLSAGVSVVTPLRAGEALRVWLLTARHKVPMLQCTGIALLEKILDAVSMFITVAPLPFLVADLPSWTLDTFRSLLLASVVATVVGFALAGFVRPSAWPDAVRALGRGLRRPPGRVAAALTILVVSWVVDLFMIWAVLDALDIALPRAASLLVLFTINLAIAIPSTPGQVGALELGAMAALELLGVPRELGLGFALLYHAIQVVPLLFVLLCDLRFVSRALKMTRAAPAEA